MGLELIMLGPPGTGKGTHAAAVSKKYGIPHISTGDMLRENVKKENKLGLEAKSYMDNGELVPDKVVIAMVVERLREEDAAAGFLLDGFPRTPDQAKELEKNLSDNNRSIRAALYIMSSKELILKRLTGRRVCEKCGKVYNIPNFMPKQEGVCDVCSGSLVQRKDDVAETVLNRLEVYENQTASLIAYYKDKGLLKDINGNLPYEQTQAEIASVLADL